MTAAAKRQDREPGTVSSDSGSQQDANEKTPYDLARMVKGRSSLLHVVLTYILPKDLEAALRPSELWIIEMCNTKELLSFSHKKKAIEEIKDSIFKEIERRRQHQKLAANLDVINGHLSALDGATGAVTKQHEADLSKKDRDSERMNQFKMLMKVDPAKAYKLYVPLAEDYMLDWEGRPLPTQAATLKGWHGLWETNERFEEHILGEEKGYKLEMEALTRHSRRAIEHQRTKDHFYIEALELAFNDYRLQSV